MKSILMEEPGAWSVQSAAPTQMSRVEIEMLVARFNKKVIEHPVHKECLSLMQAIQDAGVQDRSMARGMLVFGRTGTGKSTIAKEHEQRHPRKEQTDRTVIPVLRVELPSQPTAKAIGETILIALRDPMPHAGSAEFRMSRVRKLLTECRVDMLVLDEIQHVTGNLNSRDRDIAADSLKNLMNSTGIPVVFIGTQKCVEYFSENLELGRRCSSRIELSPFGLKTASERKDFLRLLLSLHNKLPLEGPSALIDPGTAEAFHAATFGLLGLLTQLIGCALRNTLLSGERQLTRASLHQAFREIFYLRCPPSRNPFDDRFNGGPLTARGEPFHGFRN